MTDGDTDVDWDGALVNLTPMGLLCGGRGTPLDQTWIDLSEPAHVFYGLNGAGKTTVLESLLGAIVGRKSGGRLLARIPFGDERVSNGLADAITGMLLGDELFSEEFGEEVQNEFVARQADSVRTKFSSQLRLHDWQVEGLRFADLDWPTFLDSMISSQWWLFSPVGDEGGKWRASPVVLADDCDGGLWTEFVAALHELEDSEDALADDYGLQLLWNHPAPAGAPIGICGTLVTLELEARKWFPTWPFGQVVTDTDIDVSAHTRDHLLAFPSDRWGSSPEFARDDLERRGAAIENRANALIVELLADAPALKLSVGSEEAWFRGRSCSWTATRFDGDSPMTLTALSWAERRWAEIAIQLALAEQFGAGTTWLVLDEPERGLHRSAEAHMARTIRNRVALSQNSAVATHSPELLDAGAAAVVYVRRRSHDRLGTVLPMGAFDDVRTELGLNPSDMLRRTRGIALVEGEHDLEVLRGAIGAELERLGVELLATRGGTKLKTVVDSRFLYEFTDAVLFPILDDLPVGPVGDLWNRAVAGARTQPPSEVAAELRAGIRHLPGKGGEFLGEFLSASVKNGTFDRVHPLGIPESDILACLPVDSFVPGAGSWARLRELGRASNQGIVQSEEQFKRYLEKVHRADLSPEFVRSVAERSPTHASIKAVLAAIDERLGQ